MLYNNVKLLRSREQAILYSSNEIEFRRIAVLNTRLVLHNQNVSN